MADGRSRSDIFPILLHCMAAVFVCFASETAAQNIYSIKDSDTAVSASDTATYNRIRQAMSNKKLTKRVFSLLTRKPSLDTVVNERELSVDKQFEPYEGRIINDIEVIVLPPFGYDVGKFDSVKNMKRIEQIGNNAHARTRAWVLKNSLMFRKGEAIDPLIMAETESFIRNIEYVNDVGIRIDSISDFGANVKVIVQDNWSVGAYVRNVSSKVDVELFDRNFIGLGNNFSLRGVFNAHTDRNFGGGVRYGYPNFLKTFINIDASYFDDILSTNRILSLERPLQKNLNLFGQVSNNLREINLAHTVWDSVSPTYSGEFSASLGYAFNPDKNDNTFVVSARFFDRNPQYRGVDKPENPENYQYVRNRMSLLQLNFFRQKYFRTHMVNNLGKPENFAYGYNVAAQFGFSEWPQFSKRGIYTSLKIAANKQSAIGNIYFEGAVSSFFERDISPFEGVLKLKLDMFSLLYRLGNQSYRHFLNIDYTKRLDYIPGFRNYNITFEELASMKFRNTANVTATEKLMFKTEGNLFSSLNIAGFRFVFYSFADFGWVTDHNKPLLHKDNIYWGAGLGIRIRNDLLVFRTLELKAGYYPAMNQRGFGNFVHVNSSIPNISPNFTPKYPEEIAL